MHTVEAGDIPARRPGAADFNLDGKPDVVIVYVPPTNAFSVFLNTTSPDITPPVVTVSANPSILWPANGRMVSVTLTGTITDTGSGVDANSATVEAKDEYGLVQPSGSVEVNADGSYRMQVLLTASRDGSDSDGRTFNVTVSAKDTAGNLGSGDAVVRVPHDRGHSVLRLDIPNRERISGVVNRVLRLEPANQRLINASSGSPRAFAQVARGRTCYS